MDEDLKLLIEQILGRDEKNISFKMKDFLPMIFFVILPLILEIVAVIFIRREQWKKAFSIVFLTSYAVQIFYIIIGFIFTSKNIYISYKVSANSVLQNFKNYKEKKSEILKLIEKLREKNPNLLLDFKEYLAFEKTKFDSRYSLLFEGMQNVGVFSLIILFAKNIDELSKTSAPINTISIFVFVLPLAVSLIILFEKTKAYKINQISIYLDNAM